MDFVTLLKVVAGRWYVAVPALAFTAVAVLLAARAVQPTYQADGTILLLAPATAVSSSRVTGEPVPQRINPYLRFDKNLEITAGSSRP